MTPSIRRGRRPALQSQDWISAVLTGQLELQSRSQRGTRRHAGARAARRRRAPRRPPRRPTAAEGRRPTSGLSPEAGPAFPDPITGLAVYDYAEVISPAVIERLGRTIAQHRGAHRRRGRRLHAGQAGVPTTPSGPSRTPSRSSTSGASVARASTTAWPSSSTSARTSATDRCSSTRGRAIAATYLTNAERQAIFEQQMLPALRECDFDAALTAAMERIDAAATAEHAATPAAGAPGGCRGRAHRGTPAAHRPGGLGRLELAALRAGPRLPRQRLDRSCRPRRRG